MLGDYLGGNRGPTSYEVPPESQKEPGSMTSETHHAALCPVWVLCCCPTEASGHDLANRGKVAVKVRANLCQGWPSNCTRCLRKEEGEGERKKQCGWSKKCDMKVEC